MVFSIVLSCIWWLQGSATVIHSIWGCPWDNSSEASPQAQNVMTYLMTKDSYWYCVTPVLQHWSWVPVTLQASFRFSKSLIRPQVLSSFWMRDFIRTFRQKGHVESCSQSMSCLARSCGILHELCIYVCQPALLLLLLLHVLLLAK